MSSHVPDILLIALFAFLVFRGWYRGFTRSILGVARLVLTFLITATLGATVGRTFINNASDTPASTVLGVVVGYVLTFAVTYMLLTVGMFLITRLTKLPVVASIDRVLGLALGVVCGAVALVFSATMLNGVFAIAGKQDWIEGSYVLALVNAVKNSVLN